MEELIDQHIIETTLKDKSVLDLSNIEAKAFFMKGESYCSIDLPPYFNFESLLKNIDDYLKGKNISSCFKTESILNESGENKTTNYKPENFEGVNRLLYNNKDGQYAWRPLQIINPALYVDLVNKITNEENWGLIISRFNQFKIENSVECLSIPVLSESERTDKGETIYQWWQKLEQKSVELALDFDYILHTDISNCYGSFYTHSIPWALHDKEVAKEKRKRNQLLGNYIDGSISDMSYGQTNGIPQGSVLMDFVAEMVLGYADKLLSERIKDLSEYKILRYRDDYRIFSNNPQIIQKIAKNLSEILSELGLKLNTSKTTVSDDVVSKSLKPDKVYWFSHKRSPWTIQKKLFVLYQLGNKFPNSGIIVTELNKLLKKLEKIETLNENISAISSIVVSLIIKNPKVYPVGAAILSQLLGRIINSEGHSELLSKILKKFSQVPNTGLLELWLQRMTLSFPEISFNEPLTKVIKNELVDIWELGWLNDSLKRIIEKSVIVDNEIIKELSPIIPSKEVEIFINHES